MRWVVRPVTASVDSSKARCADPFARSMDTIMATPIATPTISKIVCMGRRSKRRQERRHNGAFEAVCGNSGIFNKLKVGFVFEMAIMNAYNTIGRSRYFRVVCGHD